MIILSVAVFGNKINLNKQQLDVMKISFLGLSAFLIENIDAKKLLFDPYDDRPEYQLGAKLPSNLDAEFIYFSHKDPDHYNEKFNIDGAPGNKYLIASVPSNEFNGDDFKINVLNVDGFRIAHFGDQSTLLSKDQLGQLGKIDIAFYPPPKVDCNISTQPLKIAQNNLKQINPKIIFWSHLVLPLGWNEKTTSSGLRALFQDYLAKLANTNKNYESRESFIELCYILENAIELNNFFRNKIINRPLSKPLLVC